MPPKKYKQPRLSSDSDQPKKTRKPRAPLPRPPGLSNAEWKADVERRATLSMDRRNREKAKKVRDAAALEEEASRAAMAGDRQQAAPAPLASQFAQGVWGSQQSVASPSPSPGWRSSPSPGYMDGDAYGGFNPNVAFTSHGADPRASFAADPRAPPPYAADPRAPHPYAADPRAPHPHGYSPPYGYSPTLRRGPLAFGSSSSAPTFGSSEAEMNDIIAAGSAATANFPGFTQTDSHDADGQEHVVEDEGEEGAEEPEPVEPAPSGKKKWTGKGRRPMAEARVKWTGKEDECLAEAWKSISIDPITGANQNSDNYWRRVKTAFDERKLVDPEFTGIHMDRGEKAMANHWALIQQACNKWHGIQEEVQARPESGANVEQQMVRMFDMFRRDNNDLEFKYLHVFIRIEGCEKWSQVRLALSKSKDGVYNPDAPVSGAAEGRPEGNKKAKAARDSAPAAERLQASFDKCIADAKVHAEVREEKSEARWSALMKKQDAKIDLLRTNVAAKKRNTDLAFLTGADTATMDPQVKAWYLAERNLILNQMQMPPPMGTPTGNAAPTNTDAAPTDTDTPMDTDATPTDTTTAPSSTPAPAATPTSASPSPGSASTVESAPAV